MGNDCCAQPRNEKLPKPQAEADGSNQNYETHKGQIDIVDIGVSANQGVRSRNANQAQFVKELKDSKSLDIRETQTIESTQKEQLSQSCIGRNQSDLKIQYSSQETQGNLPFSSQEAKTSQGCDQTKPKSFFVKEDLTNSKQFIQYELMQNESDDDEDIQTSSSRDLDDVGQMKKKSCNQSQEKQVENQQVELAESHDQIYKQSPLGMINRPIPNPECTIGDSMYQVKDTQMHQIFDTQQNLRHKDTSNDNGFKDKQLQLRIAIQDSETFIDLQDSEVTRIQDSLFSPKVNGFQNSATTKRRSLVHKSTNQQNVIIQPSPSNSLKTVLKLRESEPKPQLPASSPRNYRACQSPMQSHGVTNDDIGRTFLANINELASSNKDQEYTDSKSENSSHKNYKICEEKQDEDEDKLADKDKYVQYLEGTFLKKEEDELLLTETDKEFELNDEQKLMEFEAMEAVNRLSQPALSGMVINYETKPSDDDLFSKVTPYQPVELIIESDEKDENKQTLNSNDIQLKTPLNKHLESEFKYQNDKELAKVYSKIRLNTDSQLAEFKKSVFDKVDISNYQQKNDQLLNSGSTETYELIQRIKNAYTIDKINEKQQVRNVTKHSHMTPPNLVETSSDHLQKQRKVHDILLSTLMNPVQNQDHKKNHDGSQGKRSNLQFKRIDNRRTKAERSIAQKSKKPQTKQNKNGLNLRSARMQPDLDQSLSAQSVASNSRFNQINERGTRLNPEFMQKLRQIRTARDNQSSRNSIYESQSNKSESVLSRGQGSFTLLQNKQSKINCNSNQKNIPIYPRVKVTQ